MEWVRLEQASDWGYLYWSIAGQAYNSFGCADKGPGTEMCTDEAVEDDREEL